jgi:hypothetical protein
MSSTATAQPIIELDNITKAFLTDEVETHALSGINLRIDKGAAASRRCCRSSACSTRPPLAPTCSTAIRSRT